MNVRRKLVSMEGAGPSFSGLTLLWTSQLNHTSGWSVFSLCTCGSALPRRQAAAS